MSRFKKVKFSAIRDTAYIATNNTLETVAETTSTIADTMRAVGTVAGTLVLHAEAYADAVAIEIETEREERISKAIRKQNKAKLRVARQNAKAAEEMAEYEKEIAELEAKTKS